MQISAYITLIFILFFARLSFADIAIKDIKSGSAVSPANFSVKEGFIRLDQVNTVFGAEIIFKKSLPLPANYRIVGADAPETDFSFMNKYILTTSATVEASSSVTAAETLPTDEVFDTKPAQGEVRIVTGAKKTIIQDATGSPLYEIEWQPKQTTMVSRTCPAELFKLKEVKNLPVNFPMGVSCNFSVTPGLVTISLTKEARWNSANLVEVSGKGERYRTFEIPTGNLKGQASGAFRIKSGDQTLTFAVFVKKLEDKAASFSIGFDKSIFFGMSSSTLASTSASYSSSSFFYEFAGLTDYVFTYFKVGFGFFNTFSMSEDTSVISSRDSRMTLGYYSNSKGAFNYGVWGGHRNFDVKQDISSTKFQSSQFAYGVDATYAINAKNLLIARFEMASLGSKVVKSHMKISGQYKYKLIIGKSEYNTGALFEMQNMQLATAAGDSRTYGLTKFGLSLDF